MPLTNCSPTEITQMANGDTKAESDTSSDHAAAKEIDVKKPRPKIYPRFIKALEYDPVVLKELTSGKRIGFYRIRKDLGAGNFSKVKLAVNSVTKNLVALKIIDKTRLDQKAHKLLSQEIKNMQLLFHSRVVMLYELTLVLEYADSGDLYTKVTENGRLLEPDAKRYYVQILDAIQHLHKNRIIHRDIKSENVYLHENATKIKIGDLGFSTRVVSHDQRLTTFCGSPPYAAPELFQDEMYIGKYVDVWALGILLYFLVCGQTPFRADNVPDLKQQIIRGEFKMPTQLTEECKDLITKILIKDPYDRITLPLMRSHAWTEDCGTVLTASSEDLKSMASGAYTNGLFVPMRLNIAGSAASIPRGLTDVVSEDTKRDVIRTMCEEYGTDEAEVVKLALVDQNVIRHPLMGIFRMNLHAALLGTGSRSSSRRVTIRSPAQSIIERKDTATMQPKIRTRWPSRLCSIL